MPKLDIGGQKFDVSDDWSPAKVGEFIASVKATQSQSAPMTQEPPMVAPQGRPTTKNTGEFLLDVAKTGPGKGISALGGLARGVGSVLGLNNDAPEGATLGEKFGAGFNTANDAGMFATKELTGAQDFQPSSTFQKYAKVIGEGVTDATNVLSVTPLGAAANVAKRGAISRVASGTLQNSAVGGIASGTAQVAKDSAEASGFGERGQMVASFLGGIGGAVGTANTVARVIPRGLDRAYQAVSPTFASKYLGGVRDAKNMDELASGVGQGVRGVVHDAGAAQASTALRGQLDIAAKEAGGVGALSATMDARDALSKRIGTEVPVTVAAADNRAIEEMIQKATTQSPEFRQRLKQQTTAASKGIQDTVDSDIGTQAQALERLNSYVPSSVKEVADSGRMRAKLKSDVDNLTTELFSGIRPRSEVAGDLKQAIVKNQQVEMEAMKPEYNKVLRGAEESGLKADGDMLNATVGDTIRGALEDNLFKSMPDLNRYMKVINETIKGGGSLTIRQVDGFKREVAEKMRGLERTSSEFRLLKEVQDSLKGKDYKPDAFSEPGVLLNGRKVSVVPTPEGNFRSLGLFEQINPQFAKDYAAVDAEYYKRIGEVFTEKAPMDIGKQEFASLVVPYVTRTPEAMEQFLKAAGDDAGKLGAEAVMSRLMEKVKDPKGLTPTTISNFIKANAEVISKVDAAGGNIQDTLSSVQKTLEANIAMQVGIEERTASRVLNDVLTSGTVTNLQKRFEDPQTMVTFMRNNPGDLNKWIKQVGAKNPDQREAMGTAIIQSYLRGSSPMSALENDLKSNGPLKLLVGEKMAKVAELIDAAQKIEKLPQPSGSVLKDAPKDFTSRILPGVDVKSLGGIMASKLASMGYKGLSIFRLVTNKKAETEATKQLSDLLLTPGRLTGALENMKAAAASTKDEAVREGFIAKGLGFIGDVAKNSGRENLLPGVRSSANVANSEGIDDGQRRTEIENFFNQIRPQEPQ